MTSSTVLLVAALAAAPAGAGERILRLELTVAAPVAKAPPRLPPVAATMKVTLAKP